MTETLRELLIRFKWADQFNADTLVRLIQDRCDCSSQGKLYTYKVKEILRVIDGDTMIVNVDLGFDVHPITAPSIHRRCTKRFQS